MLILLAVTLKGQVFINEIMQSNIDCIMDDLNDFPDSWVEVYNGTSSVINLADYKLGETTPQPRHGSCLISASSRNSMP